MTPVLVTGASGWLGGRVVAQLLEAGHDVRCLVEPGVDPGRLAQHAELAWGDVRDPSAVAPAVAGAEAVVHCAAVIHPRRARDFRAVNFQGTNRVIEAAARAGVRRLLHVSSNAAAGAQRDRDTLLTEADPPAPQGGYGRSKLEAELAVLAAHARGDLEAAVIRPCRFYGPVLAARVKRVFELIRSRRIPVCGAGLALRSMSSVDDVARVLVQCLDDPRAAGETFWIADEPPYTTFETFQAMAAAAEVPLRTRRFPEAMARSCEVLARAYERLGRYSMSLHLAGESYRNVGCSIEKAKRVLGFDPRNDLVGGFRDALEQVCPAPPLVPA